MRVIIENGRVQEFGDIDEGQEMPNSLRNLLYPQMPEILINIAEGRLHTAEELAALGYDQEGVPLPTEAELAAQALEAEAKVLEAEAEALAQKAVLNAGYGDKLKLQAEQAALAELIAKRAAAKLAALQKEHAGTLERAEARAAEYAAEARAKKEKTKV